MMHLYGNNKRGKLIKYSGNDHCDKKSIYLDNLFIAYKTYTNINENVQYFNDKH